MIYISAWFFTILTFTGIALKIAIHMKLDRANGYKAARNRVEATKYLLTYKMKVKEEDYALVKTCNSLQKVNLVLIILMFASISLYGIFCL